MLTLSKRNKIIGIVVILALIGLGYFFRSELGFGEAKLKNVDRKITAEQRQAIEGKIKKGEDFLRTLDLNQQNGRLDYINAQIYMAQQYSALGELEKARGFYNEVLKREPNNPSALTGLAVILSEAGDTEGVRLVLEQGVKENPSNYDLWIRYIDFKLVNGATTQEVDDTFTEALKSTGRYIDLLTKDAQFQEKVGNFVQAVSLWEEVARKYPENAALYQQEAERVKKALPK